MESCEANGLGLQLHRAATAIGLNGNAPYLGEVISKFEHGLQAAYFAETAGHGIEVQLASLLHDIGHYAYKTVQPQMGQYGAINHEWIGARLAMEYGFGERIAALVGYHVDAKRYLAAKKASYFERLSAASRQTLIYQGGPMSEKERLAFEKNPLYKAILQVRTNDEKGKALDLKLPEFTYYRQKMARYLGRCNGSHAIDEDKTIFLVNAAEINHKAVSDEINGRHFDMVLCYPLESVLNTLSHLLPDQLIIKDYFFAAGAEEVELDELNICFDAPLSNKQDYIDEFVSLVRKSTICDYLIVAPSHWYSLLSQYFGQRQEVVKGQAVFCHLRLSSRILA
ncbi:MAG: HD domain-containing protein [Francisellaceae bacterium]